MVSPDKKALKGPGLSSNFQWGFATAAYQVEGGASEGGRGPSIWDTFTHLEPSRTSGASDEVACDHYHRLDEDLDLLAKYGARAYRFSLSWSRIIPLGGREDPVNEEGIAFYNRLIDGLVARGIALWITLYHGNLPQALHDRYGGWLNVEERFGDRTKNWITLNEPWTVSIHGYSLGIDAPGRSSTNRLCDEGDSSREPWIVGKALIMAHARAASLYKKKYKSEQGGRVGVSLNGDYLEPWDIEEPKDHEAAERRMDFSFGWFANPMMFAQDYPASMRAHLGDRLPEFRDAELALLRDAELDFYGMNYYTAQFARHRSDPAGDTDYMGNMDEYQRNKAGVLIGEPAGVWWLCSAPDCFRKHLVRIHQKFRKPIYVTENGCPCPSEENMHIEESVKDEYRQRYFADHLDAIAGAIPDGAEVHGYFAWSLMDNLEWGLGYKYRFGVTFTDYETLERTPKESALKLRGMIEDRMNGLIPLHQAGR
ncbi:glycoside hydrolase superfamily [Aspergillus crustosus]